MVDQSVHQLAIKGIREGLLVHAGNLSLDSLLARIPQELSQKQFFLEGSRVALQLEKQMFTAVQLKAVKQAMADQGLELWAVLSENETTRQAARQLELGTRLAGSQTDLNGNALPSPHSPDTDIRDALPDQDSLFIRETIRSGRKIYSAGSITIIGDVNPGAEIIAGGHVLVWGRLRGLVHAGAHGDKTAVICALALNPTQLRIADQIAIAPNDGQTAVYPEQALVRNGQIVAEPWRP